MSTLNRRSFLALTGGMLAASRLSFAETKTAPLIPSGAWPVMYTPFTKSGAVDLDAVKELTEFYVDAKVGGIFAAAFSGEVFDLSFDEALDIGKQAVRQADGRVGVVVGANFGTTIEEQAASLRRMHDIGVDAAVIILSKLPSPEDLEGQLLKLAGLTTGPLGIYECPRPEHRQISAETAGRIAHTGRFNFVKETSPKAASCGAKVEAAKGTPMRIFSATLSIAPEVLDLGVDGHCGTVANICPELTRLLCETKDKTERDRIHQSLEAINGPVVSIGYPSSGKYFLQKRGLRLTTVSRAGDPAEFNDELRKKLDDLFKRVDFQHGLLANS